jgi:hypothetical protein
MTTPLPAKRPQPVITPQVIIAAFTFAVGQAVAFGLVPEATSTKVISVVPIVVGAAFALIAALHSTVAVFSAKKVTPTDDPHAMVVRPDGTQVLEPLVPLSLAVQAIPNQAGVEDLSDNYSDLVATTVDGPAEPA